jgi:hypothetical protein
VPVCEECLHAAATATKVGFSLFGAPRAVDPTGFVDVADFAAKTQGVQEFAIDVPGFMEAMAAMGTGGAGAA